jgi:hypothetical protein
MRCGQRSDGVGLVHPRTIDLSTATLFSPSKNMVFAKHGQPETIFNVRPVDSKSAALFNRLSISPTPGGSVIRLSTSKNRVKTAAIIFEIVLLQKFCETVTRS